VPDIERLMASLETLPNTLSWSVQTLRWRLGDRSPSISLVITTSGAVVSEVRHQVGAKVWWALMWNLPRGASEDYAEQLGL